jgi:hypothetical protein
MSATISFVIQLSQGEYHSSQFFHDARSAYVLYKTFEWVFPRVKECNQSILHIGTGNWSSTPLLTRVVFNRIADSEAERPVLLQHGVPILPSASQSTPTSLYDIVEFILTRDFDFARLHAKKSAQCPALFSPAKWNMFLTAFSGLESLLLTDYIARHVVDDASVSELTWWNCCRHVADGHSLHVNDLPVQAVITLNTPIS